MIGRIQVKYSENLVQSPLRNSIGGIVCEDIEIDLTLGALLQQ